MSQQSGGAGGKKNWGKGTPMKKNDEKNKEENKNDKDVLKEEKEPRKEETTPTETEDTTTETEEANTTPSKPSSAGTNVRDVAHRILMLCQKSEWGPIDQLLKTIERSVAGAGEDVHVAPLAGVLDTATGMTPLMFAIKDNRTSLVERMLNLGSDVTARNNENFNGLHIAALHAREDIVKLLLAKKGCDPYSTGGIKNQTAVHIVASRQTGTATAILRALLSSAGKDIRLKVDGNGKIPLLLAVEAGNQSMVRELLHALPVEQLKAQSASGDAALHLAVRRKDIDMVRILVDYGTSVDIQNGQGQTPLHIAAAEGDEVLVKYFYGVPAEYGHANIIELLADKFRASILERTKDGSTLMHIASLNGHADCAMMLFKKGVYVHMPNKNGARSIHTAARYGHVGIINTLIQRGEKVDVTTNENYTALHIAVESCKPSVVETLLGYGANVHLRGGKLKETALHIAARVEDGERCALMLLKSGAGPNLLTDDGQTPVHVAAKYGNLQTLLLLLEDGGDPEYKNKHGETPLHLAAKGCQPKVVRELINYVKEKKGEEKATHYINGVNENDESALHYICTVASDKVRVPKADEEVVNLLLGNGADVKLQTKHHETAFHYVATVGNNTVLMAMISHMDAQDAQKALSKQNSNGWTPLMIASNKGHSKMVDNFLTNSARVDVFDIDGRSALHLAAEHGYLHVCGSLLEHKAFINSKARNGQTALHLAAKYGFIHLVRFLVKEHNAVVDILTLKKQTPLHLASAAGQIEVCKLLLELGANIDATDDQGQKPIHAACSNNHSEVAKLFLQEHPSLVMAMTKDGNTCAHIAAAQGSVTVIEELMKFDKQGVINARNKMTDATPLQIAAEGGHAEVVKALVRAGANITDENKAGFTAVHLAAQNGHISVLEVFKPSNTLRIISKKLGVTPLHVAAYYGQADTVRELLTYCPGTVKTEPPSGGSLVPILGNESGMTPLHLASFSGNENVVRLLLNSTGVQVEAATHENGYNPMHLACYGGHVTVVGLLLSRQADLLQSQDKHGKTGLHIAATQGHYAMVEVLLGQGAEINAPDKNGWTPLHCASKAGCFDVVKLLTESGASPKSETNLGAVPIWFAASEGHHDVLQYLMTKEHDTYALMEDRRFVYNLMVCSKNHENKPMEEFILVSPAPVDTAAKLSNILIVLSNKEKERAKDLIAAGKYCEYMATELLALAAGADSAGKILTSVDRRSVEFLDVLIENEQKEVIAHTVVQRYLQELWKGGHNWAAWRTLLLFLLFIICPPVWIAFTLPLGHKYYKVPIIKFMSYLTSHVYLLVFLLLVAIIPPYPIVRSNLFPYWYEWILLIWLSGLLLFELTNPSDKSGLGWIKLSVLLLSIMAVSVHVIGIIFVQKSNWPTLMYCRNQLFALSFVAACVQILDFLSFHHLFGPWAIIIGNLMKDLGRFLAVLAIFVFGFSMQFVALNQKFQEKLTQDEIIRISRRKKVQYFTDVIMSPLLAFERLFFAVFGQTTWEDVIIRPPRNTPAIRPDWTENLFKVVFGIYMLVSVVVLINLLIAMMSDTYQRIQAQSDIEWKFGLSKLIRSMHRTTTAPSPINLITTWLFYLIDICRKRIKKKKRQSMAHLVQSFKRPESKMSPRSKAGQKWLSKIKKVQVAPKQSLTVSVARASFGSQLSFNLATTRIEHVADWELIANRYRALIGHMDEVKEKSNDNAEEKEEEDNDQVENQPG
ncbi:hypothetical protein WA026_012092 [Henosepilachna vigintioctopunctata]|uniref:Ion transport domain-containing protein n=1 Tax=Henosepilachna vigintioctopunctata TaxID=420089 RepID=A0AAW1VF51_9CUCU